MKAGDRVRTGDIQLGKLTLYELSYTRRFRWGVGPGRSRHGIWGLSSRPEPALKPSFRTGWRAGVGLEALW